MEQCSSNKRPGKENYDNSGMENDNKTRTSMIRKQFFGSTERQSYKYSTAHNRTLASKATKLYVTSRASQFQKKLKSSHKLPRLHVIGK